MELRLTLPLMEFRRLRAKMSEEQAAPLEQPKPVESDNGLSVLQAELVKVQDQLREVVGQRDNLKKTQDDAETARLAEQGEFQQLAEQRGTELEGLTGKVGGLETRIKQYEERDEAKLQTLIELIPENLRETLQGNSGTLAEKIDLAERLATVKPIAPGARPGGDTHTATLQEDYDQARKDGNVLLQVALKRQLFEKRE